jgi:hypothetical protein
VFFQTKKSEKPEWSKKADGGPPKPGAVRRQSAASSKAEEPPAQPVEPEVEEEEGKFIIFSNSSFKKYRATDAFLLFFK